MNPALQPVNPQVDSHAEYIHEHHSAHATKMVQQRNAAVHGAFFLPHLHAGMTLLDCGCGPGTITAGLAEAVAPGLTIGVDLAVEQIELAKTNVAHGSAANVRFEVQNVYALSYADATFDAVFAHALIGHLHDPVSALREMGRVLKPGGVIGVRDPDFAGFLLAPTDSLIDGAFDLYVRFRQDNGGDPYIGRRLREHVRRAGLARTRGSAAYECWGTEEETGYIVDVLLAELTGPRVTRHAMQRGWADETYFDQVASALRRWGANPDAIWAHAWFEVVGWKA
jgi:ubiquinone/menaquinone biosynthesis C-methylase UbiE